MRIMLSAGEASGDNYGALLLSELRSRAPIEAFGLGGERMRAAGCELIAPASEVAAVGITEIIRHIPRIYMSYRKLVTALRERRPDVLVLIDFPDINFKLARHAHALGIPTIFFISPQIWAWKPWRIHLVRRYVTKMLVIFPFEETFYRERGVDVEF
ncbi:MAG: lipid-A-disaccharide synthase, partial [Acidobacteriales bacterium]|nr:lipid-A-disaccharide synthase [Terriglobales bacterium]